MKLSTFAILTQNVPPEPIPAQLADVSWYEDAFIYQQPVGGVNVLTKMQFMDMEEAGFQKHPKPYACQLFIYLPTLKPDPLADALFIKGVNMDLPVDAIVKEYPKVGKGIMSFLEKEISWMSMF